MPIETPERFQRSGDYLTIKVLEYAFDRPTCPNPRQKQIPNQKSLPGKLTNLPTQTKITTTVPSVAGPLT
ncbi:MAG: hypothetical protein EA000_21405 [Oscillatoriales cyanobacterium]|nr:MAG: hypothetical protein EA000_21405 [Oscillatoriales cyanobacterium]TAF43884.1 MAG: hypothetical protein EAZ68_07270 [Oscillatoriales cyanobacterium]